MNLTENIFCNSPFGFSYGKVIFDDQGLPSDYRIKSINKEFERLAEMKADDVIGKKATEIDFPISFQNGSWKHFLNLVVQNEGKASQKIFSSTLKKWFRVQAWFDENENLAIIFTHITDRSDDIKAPMTDLQEFREVFDRVPHSVFIIDVIQNQRFIVNDFNEIQTEYLNMDRNDIQGKFVEDIFPDDVAELIIGHYSNCLNRGEEITYEEDVVLPGRGRRQYLTTLSPIKDVSGEIYRLVGSSIEITDRKQAEEALKKSEEQYRSFVQNSSEGIYLFEFTEPMDLSLSTEEQISYIYQEGYISTCNDVMAKMYGYDKSEDLISKDIVELHGSDNNPANIAYLKNVIDHNYRIKDQLSVEKDVDDNDVYFMNNVYGIIEDNALVRVWASQRDVTEQKKAEKSLKRTEALQSKMVSNIGDVIVIIGADGSNRYKSPNIEKHFGWKPEELVGKNSFALIHPDDREQAQMLVEQLMESPNVKTSNEVRYQHKNGDYRWINFTAVNLMNDPDVQGILGNYHDITDQKEAREDLRKSEERFRALAYNVPGVIYLCKNDERYTMTFINDQVENLTGYSSEEFMEGDLNFMELYHPEDSEWLIGQMDKALDERRTFQMSYRIRHKNGDYRWVLEHGAGIYDEEGNLQHLEGYLTNITEQKEADELIYKASQKLEESLSEKETLLSEIHHRVKNNLAVVSGMMQLQAYDTTNEELQAKLFDSVIRIKTMASVHELLYQSNSFSRLDFSDTIVKLVENISGTLQTSTHINLDIHCDHIKLNINKAIPASLIVNEVITNIYKHAFKGRTEGEIVFRVNQADDDILINITDNGSGFDKDEIQNSSSLGMHLIKELTNQIDGRYEYNTSEKGTEFILQFTKA